MNCRQFIIRGKVQGVYFRVSLQQEARRLGLKGYVMNRADGSVFAEAEGEEEALAALEKWCWKGSPLSRVDLVKVTAKNAEGAKKKGEISYVGFEVRR